MAIDIDVKLEIAININVAINLIGIISISIYNVIDVIDSYIQFQFLNSSVVDPHHVDADPHHVDADPDPWIRIS